MSKKIKSILTAFIIVSIVSLIACKGNTSETNEVRTESQGKEYTSAYVCPMHCEGSGSNKEGKCPVCSMTYIPNDNDKKSSHQHD